MASVPAVVAVTMAGKDEPSVMVPVMPKLMVSSPAEALASIIACRRVPAPASALEETVMVAGVILCSRKVSWGGRRKGLGFLFELVNRLKIFVKKLPILKIPIKDYQISKT
jgi:hypothetical protein